jgi:hypothetical protein
MKVCSFKCNVYYHYTPVPLSPLSPPPGGYVIGQPDPAPQLSIPPPAPQAIGRVVCSFA